MTARALNDALAAQARGHSVIPINKHKAPAVRSAHPEGDPQRRQCKGECGRLGHGVHDATADPDKLRALFTAARTPSGYNTASGYAVACGREPHRLVGIDLDIKHGDDGPANLRDLADLLGITIPDTVRVTTPSGGHHLWLTAPAHVTIGNSVGKLAPGIDVRGSGGMLIGPGSRTADGAYRLVTPPDTPIAPVPGPLLDLMRKAPVPRPRTGFADSAGQVSNRISALIATVHDAKPGQRNNVLYWSGCRMAEAIADGYVTEDEGRTLLLAAASRTGLDYAEADGAITSAFRSAVSR